MSNMERWNEGERSRNKRTAEPEFRRKDAGYDTRRKGKKPRKDCREPSFTRKN